MTQARATGGQHLTLVPSGGEEDRTPPAGAGAPVLVGLLVCADGGQALGVVREVLGWDGRELSLAVTLTPEQERAGQRTVVTLPMAGAGNSRGPRLRTVKP